MKKIILIILFSLTFSIFSQELLKDKWVIEWNEFEGKNLSLSNQLLLTSIPTYFMNNIDSEHNHYPNVLERESIFNDLKREKKRELFFKRSKLINEKDEFLFSKGTEAQIEEVIKKIDDVQIEIDLLKTLNFDEESFPTDYDIKYLGVDSLSTVKVHEIPYHLKRDNVDYFIGGEIEEELGNLFLTIKLYSKYSDEPVVVWSGVGVNEEILSYRPEMLDRLSRIIISEEIISYAIDTTPKEALIYIDDLFKALGHYNGYTVSSENLKIDILKEGYNSLSLQKEITKEDNELLFQLIPIESETITVTSIPLGASVYYGSMYIGVTPIDVPLFSYSQKLTLSYDGYMERSFVINSHSKNMDIKLTEGIFDREENFAEKKKNFYISTALFSIGLATHLYFDSVDGDIDEIVMNISLGSAVVLGLNMFYSLYSYLNAAEISVE